MVRTVLDAFLPQARLAGKTDSSERSESEFRRNVELENLLLIRILKFEERAISKRIPLAGRQRAFKEDII